MSGQDYQTGKPDKAQIILEYYHLFLITTFKVSLNIYIQLILQEKINKTPFLPLIAFRQPNMEETLVYFCPDSLSYVHLQPLRSRIFVSDLQDHRCFTSSNITIYVFIPQTPKTRFHLKQILPKYFNFILKETKIEHFFSNHF